MTIYVDPLNDWGWILRGNHTKSCHLFTDSVDLKELHEFAQKIGMRRSWLHADPRHPHYDLTPVRRLAAVTAGAKEVNFHEAVRIIRLRRERTGLPVMTEIRFEVKP